MKKQNGFLLPNLNLYLIGGAVVIALAVAGTIAYKFNSLKTENAQLVLNNKTLKDDNDKLILVNKQNVLVIEQMQTDKKTADKVLEKLENQKDKDAAELNKLRADIRKIVKADPAQDAVAAPILKQTILELQKHYNPSETKEKTQ